VLGGGFAGFWAAVAARRVHPGLDITVVSSKPVLEIRPRLYEAAPEKLQVELPPLLARVGIEFTLGEATAVDRDANRLALADGTELTYSRLVVATGSAIRRPSIPAASKAHTIDSVPEAVGFDRRLAEIVGEESAPSVAVIGAGFTGIELALELRDRIAVHGCEEQARRTTILLLDRAQVVGASLGPGPRPLIAAALTEARVTVRLGVLIAALSATSVVLADGEVINVDAVVLTTGMEAAPFARAVPGSHDDLGRVVVDSALRAPGAPDIFVAGDAAAVGPGDGLPLLQSCQHALQMGRFAGENAARELTGWTLLPYSQPSYITCLDLGRSGAVYTRGRSRRIERVGGEAKAVKRRINRETIYPPVEATPAELLRMSSLDPALQQRPRRLVS
jgi:NADH dehydrogenase